MLSRNTHVKWHLGQEVRAQENGLTDKLNDLSSLP